MGFVKIFWKNNIQVAYVPKTGIVYAANCLWDISPVLLWWLYTNSSKFDLDANGDYHLFKVRKNGQQKTCNLSCNIAVKQVE